MDWKDKFISCGFIFEKHKLNADYKKLIGSYHLVALLNYENGKEVGVYAYYIWNSRKGYIFKIRHGAFFVLNCNREWIEHKALPQIPTKVSDEVKRICIEI